MLCSCLFILFQQRNVNAFKQDGQTLKYRLDNEFDLVFLVCFILKELIVGFSGGIPKCHPNVVCG
jgi:hypothetical protein